MGYRYLQIHEGKRSEKRLHEFLVEKLKKYTFRSAILVINQKAIPFSDFCFSEGSFLQDSSRLPKPELFIRDGIK